MRSRNRDRLTKTGISFKQLGRYTLALGRYTLALGQSELLPIAIPLRGCGWVTHELHPSWPVVTLRYRYPFGSCFGGRAGGFLASHLWVPSLSSRRLASPRGCSGDLLQRGSPNPYLGKTRGTFT